MDRIEEYLLLHWLYQEIFGSQFHCADSQVNVRMSGDQNRRDVTRFSGQPFQQLKSAHARQPNVSDDTGGQIERASI